jgi:hypothetical protein
MNKTLEGIHKPGDASQKKKKKGTGKKKKHVSTYIRGI